MKGALDVHRELLARDVPHEVVRLRRAVASADDLPGALELDAGSCAALRCYVADGRTVAVMVAAGATPDPTALLDALGADAVRAATTAEVNAATDYAAGLVSPICLPGDVELLVDSALAQAEVLYTAVGEGGVALGIRTRDLLLATGARVASLTAGPLRAADRTGWDGVLDLTGPHAVISPQGSGSLAARTPRQRTGR